MKSRLIVILGLMISATSVFGGQFPLVTITNEESREVTHFLLETSDDNAVVTGFRKVDKLDGKVTDSKKFNVDEDAQNVTFTLVRLEGRNVVQLKSNDFASQNGGQVIIDYLKNGVSGSRSHLETGLERAGESWQLVDKNNRAIKHLHFVSNKFLGRTIGIDKVKVTLK